MKNRFVLLLLLPATLCAQVRYSITPLVPNEPAIGNSSAGRINQFGDVAGGYFNGGALHGFVFTDQTGFTGLGSGPLGILNINGINNAGQISGYGPVPGGSGTHAFRYTPGVGFFDLGTGAGFAAETSDINNSGQVVGTYTANDGTDHAFRYSDGVEMEYLGLSSQSSAARAVNHLGWVTGTSDSRAFLYKDGVGAIDIGAGSGWGINEAGIVVGENLSLQPVLYMDGQTIPLGGTGRATGINNHNLIVGTANDESFMHGFVWSQEEGMLDLNSLIDPNSGWFIASAGRVNDAGQIVGWGFSPERGGVPTPFRLNPVPEPSIWAILIIGTGTLFIFRRRKV